MKTPIRKELTRLDNTPTPTYNKEEVKMKTLLSGTIVIIFLVLLVSFSWAGEVGQTCTVIKGNQVAQVFPGGIRPATVPKDHSAKVTGNISDEDLNYLNKVSGTDWSGSVYLEFKHNFKGNIGVKNIKIIAKPHYLKDCK